MNSVTTTLTLESTGGPVRAEVSAWDDGSILVLVGGVAVVVDDVGAVARAVRWAALDAVVPHLVREIPAQEVADRAAAAVEQAALHASAEAARVAEEEAAAVALETSGAAGRGASASARVAAPALATDPASIDWSNAWVVIGDGDGCTFCDRSRVLGLHVGTDRHGDSVYVCSDCARNALATL